MDSELKAKWVAALRSGEFKQGQGRLFHEDRYCCLGVLCAVAGEPTEQSKPQDGHGFYSDAFRERVGLDAMTQWKLARMNDGTQNKSFPEIADYIEANL